MTRRVVRLVLEVDGPEGDAQAVAGAEWSAALPDAYCVRVLEAVRAPSGRAVLVADVARGRFHVPVGPFATRAAAVDWAAGERVRGVVERLWEPADFADVAAERARAGHPVTLYSVAAPSIIPPTALLQMAGLAPHCLIGVIATDTQTDALVGPFVDDASLAVYVGEVIGRPVAAHDVIAYPIYRPHDYRTADHILAAEA